MTGSAIRVLESLLFALYLKCCILMSSDKSPVLVRPHLYWPSVDAPCEAQFSEKS